MKKIFSLLIIITVLLCSSFYARAEKAVHEIASKEDLQLLNEFPEDDFVLTDDIYFWDNPIEPFCKAEKAFKGTLDGKGHSIKCVNCKSNAEAVALFEINDGIIKNIVFSEITVKALSESAVVSGITVFNNGTIENCIFNGAIFINNTRICDNVFSAYNSGKIIDCKDYSSYPNNSELENEYTFSMTVPRTSSSSSVDTTESSSSKPSKTSGTSSVKSEKQSNSNKTSSTVSENKKSTVSNDNSSALTSKATNEFVEIESDGKENYFGDIVAVITLIIALIFAGLVVYREIQLSKQKNNKEQEK